MEGRGPDESYFCQLQGQLLVTGQPWVDIISFYPGLPDVVIRVEPDEEFMGVLETMLDDLHEVVNGSLARLAARGYEPFQHVEQPNAFDVFLNSPTVG